MNGIDIDRIVHEVLAELEHRRPAVVKAVSKQPAAVDWTDRKLVALADLQGLQRTKTAPREILVGPKTVVTPSLRDELRKQGFSLQVGLPKSGEIAAKATKQSIWLGVQRPLAEPAAVLAMLRQRGEVITVMTESVEAATDEIGRQIKERSCIVMTPAPARLLCLANRHGAVWGIAGFDPAQTASDARELGANLLVCNPAGKSEFRQLEIIKAFLQGVG